MFGCWYLRYWGSNSVGGNILSNYIIVHIANFSPVGALNRGLNRTAEKVGCLKEDLERYESM